MPWAMVVGESLIDVVHPEDGREPVAVPGGSPKNVAVALARLGRSVRLLTAFGADEHGRMLADDLGRVGVDLMTDPYAVDHTSTAVARIGADGSAAYELDVDWRLPPVPEDLLQPPPLVLHTGSLGAALSPGADAVLDLLARLRGTTVSYDVNARPVVTGVGPAVVARAEEFAALADVVKVSEEDLQALWPDLPTDDAARRLLDLGPRVVTITRGAGGATWLAEDAEVSVTAPLVEVVDTIGAGDTFMAALLDALWERGRLGGDSRLDVEPDEAREILEHAVAASAVTVARAGADPPTRAELGTPRVTAAARATGRRCGPHGLRGRC